VDLLSSPGHLDYGDPRLARQYDVNFARNDQFQLRVVVDVVVVAEKDYVDFACALASVETAVSTFRWPE